MVQNVGSKQGGYGSIDRVGTSPDGRVIYKVTDPNGKVAGGLSVAPNDCDRFEHSYKSIMEAAPKVEKYMKTHTEEDLKKSQKKGRWITAIGAFTGGIIPAVLIRQPKKLVKILATAAGSFAGLFAGAAIARRTTIPPGVEEMTRASQELSKLDIKPA